MGKNEECGGCIGFDEKHTCDGWAEFQIMKAEKDKCHSCVTLRAEIEQLRKRGDGHAETLKGIAAMNPETEGERMRQWANDGLSGYTESTEATVKRLQDEIEQLRKALRFYGKDAAWSSTVIDKYSGELTLFDWDGDIQDEPWEVAERALQTKGTDTNLWCADCQLPKTHADCPHYPESEQAR